MVETVFVTEQDFREFTFTDAARLHTRNNPGFFKGTVVEQAVADELGLERASPAATAETICVRLRSQGRAHPQIAWAKVRTLRDGAAIVKKKLWS